MGERYSRELLVAGHPGSSKWREAWIRGDKPSHATCPVTHLFGPDAPLHSKSATHLHNPITLQKLHLRAHEALGGILDQNHTILSITRVIFQERVALTLLKEVMLYTLLTFPQSFPQWKLSLGTGTEDTAWSCQSRRESQVAELFWEWGCCKSQFDQISYTFSVPHHVMHCGVSRLPARRPPPSLTLD